MSNDALYLAGLMGATAVTPSAAPTWGPWHMAQGALPSSEAGFSLSVSLHRQGDQCIAVADVATAYGPLRLTATASVSTISRLLGVTGAALEAVVKKLATVSVVKKATNIALPTPTHPAAERLYARLLRKEPGAKESLKKLLAMAKLGNPKAKNAVAMLKQIHARMRGESASGCSGTSLSGASVGAYRGLGDAYNFLYGGGPSLAGWNLGMRLPQAYPQVFSGAAQAPAVHALHAAHVPPQHHRMPSLRDQGLSALLALSH